MNSLLKDVELLNAFSEVGPGLASLARAFERADLTSALHDMAATSVALVPGAVAASVTLWRERGPYTLAATDDVVQSIDAAQYDALSGPCVDAARDGLVFVIDDTRTDPRWPSFSASAAREGIYASLSLPLVIGQDVIGSVNIYGREPFLPAAQSTARVVASYGGIVTLAASVLLEARERAENLQKALESRQVIDRAIGMVMQRDNVSQDSAFAILARQSQNSNRKLRDIADTLVSDYQEPPTTLR